MATVNVQLTPPLGFDQRSNFTTMGFIQADRTHPSLKRKFGPVFGGHLSTEQVKKIKTNPESFDGQSIQDYLASTAGIPGRDTSKLNLEIPLSALTAVPTPGSFQSTMAFDERIGHLEKMNEAQQKMNKAQQETNEDLRSKIRVQVGKIETLNSYLEDTVISIYKVNLMTDFAKTLSQLQGEKLSKGESARNDEDHSVTRLEAFVTRLEEKQFKKLCPNLDRRYFATLQEHYSTMIHARNDLAHETTVQFAKWLDTDEIRDKPHNRGWAGLLVWVSGKPIQELAAMPLPFSDSWEKINKEFEQVEFNHALSLTEEDHSTPEQHSPHEKKRRGGKKPRRGKPFRLSK